MTSDGITTGHTSARGLGYLVPPTFELIPNHPRFLDGPHNVSPSNLATKLASKGKASTVDAFTSARALSPSMRDGQSLFAL